MNPPSSNHYKTNVDYSFLRKYFLHIFWKTIIPATISPTQIAIVIHPEIVPVKDDVTSAAGSAPTNIESTSYRKVKSYTEDQLHIVGNRDFIV